MKIHPISVGLPVKQGTELKIRIISFDTDAVSCTVYWELLSEEKQRLIEGNINLTEEEFAAWGKDNSYIETLVLGKLGLQALNVIEEIEVTHEQLGKENKFL